MFGHKHASSHKQRPIWTLFFSFFFSKNSGMLSLSQTLLGFLMLVTSPFQCSLTPKPELEPGVECLCHVFSYTVTHWRSAREWFWLAIPLGKLGTPLWMQPAYGEVNDSLLFRSTVHSAGGGGDWHTWTHHGMDLKAQSSGFPCIMDSSWRQRNQNKVRFYTESRAARPTDRGGDTRRLLAVDLPPGIFRTRQKSWRFLLR